MQVYSYIHQFEDALRLLSIVELCSGDSNVWGHCDGQWCDHPAPFDRRLQKSGKAEGMDWDLLWLAMTCYDLLLSYLSLASQALFSNPFWRDW